MQHVPKLVKGIVLGDSKRENISRKPPVTLKTYLESRSQSIRGTIRSVENLPIKTAENFRNHQPV